MKNMEVELVRKEEARETSFLPFRKSFPGRGRTAGGRAGQLGAAVVPKMQPGQKAGLFFTDGHSHPLGGSSSSCLGAPAPGGPTHSSQAHRHCSAPGPSTPQLRLFPCSPGDSAGPLFLQGHSGLCHNWGGGQNTLKCKVGGYYKETPPAPGPLGSSWPQFPSFQGQQD